MRVGKFDVAVVGAGPGGSTSCPDALVGRRRGSPSWTRRPFRGTRPAATWSGRGLSLCSTNSGSSLRGALPVGDMLVVGSEPTVGASEVQGGSVLSRIRARLEADRPGLRDQGGGTRRRCCADRRAGRIGRRDEEGHNPRDERTATMIECDAVIGADGATSRVAESFGLVDRSKVQWGFAVRTYLEVGVALADDRALGADRRGRRFPVTAGSSRLRMADPTPASEWARCQSAEAPTRSSFSSRSSTTLPDSDSSTAIFNRPVRRQDVFSGVGSRWEWWARSPPGAPPCSWETRQGSSTRSRERGSLRRSRAARPQARALIGNPGEPANSYKTALAKDHLPYHRITADVQRAMVTRPRAHLGSRQGPDSARPRQDICVGLGALLERAPRRLGPGFARTVAVCAQAAGGTATARTSTRRWFNEAYGTQAV